MLTELRRRLVVALVVAAAFPARAVAAALLAVPGVREKSAKVWLKLVEVGQTFGQTPAKSNTN